MDEKRTRLTRRRLIQVGGSAAAVMYIGRLPTLALADTTAPGFLRRSSYAGLVGSEFEAVGSGATLTLTAVADLARAQSEPAFVGRDDAFALSFVGRTTSRWPAACTSSPTRRSAPSSSSSPQ